MQGKDFEFIVLLNRVSKVLDKQRELVIAAMGDLRPCQ